MNKARRKIYILFFFGGSEAVHVQPNFRFAENLFEERAHAGFPVEPVETASDARQTDAPHFVEQSVLQGGGQARLES